MQEFNMTTKNSNFHKTAFSLPKRRMSRQSNENFTNIDFEYIGNTANVSVKTRISDINPFILVQSFD